MKTKINKVEYLKEFESKFGTMYLHKVHYDDTYGLYTSKSKDQDKFVAGQEAEFTVVVKTSKDGNEFNTIKPVMPASGNFGRALKKEQSRYSGFACSYAKDLAVAGRIQVTEIPGYTKAMFRLMVELDKTLEQ